MKLKITGQSHISRAKREAHSPRPATVPQQDLNENIVQSIMDKTWASRHEQPILKPGVHSHKP
jgi:hypothetical protein